MVFSLCWRVITCRTFRPLKVLEQQVNTNSPAVGSRPIKLELTVSMKRGDSRVYVNSSFLTGELKFILKSCCSGYWSRSFWPVISVSYPRGWSRKYATSLPLVRGLHRWGHWQVEVPEVAVSGPPCVSFRSCPWHGKTFEISDVKVGPFRPYRF